MNSCGTSGLRLPMRHRPQTTTSSVTIARNAVLSSANRSSQPLAAVMSTFNFMKQFSMFAGLAAASGGSAPSR
jgi:hypothetical protein